MSTNRSRCVNCGIDLFHMKSVKVGDLQPDEIELLRQWITYYDVSGCELLCHVCALLLQDGEEGSPRAVGHPEVCLCCGRSLKPHNSTSRARCRTFPTHHHDYQRIMESVKPDVPDYIWGMGLKNLCYACGQRYARRVEIASRAPPEVRLVTEDGTEQFENEADGLGESEVEQTLTGVSLSKTIKLQEYKRVVSQGCVAGPSNCSGSLKPVPLSLRQSSLRRGALYIPPTARLCEAHSRRPPPVTVSCDHTFTPDQIADMLFLLKGFPPLDLTDSMDEHMCRVYLGVDVSEYKDMVSRCQSNFDSNEAHMAAAAYYLRSLGRECDTVLASILQCDPDKVKPLAKLASECRPRSAENGLDESRPHGNDAVPVVLEDPIQMES